MNGYRIVLAALALVVGGQAKAELVTGNAVNCREAPAATARVLQKLHRGQEVSVERYEGSWALLDQLECWASAAYLSNGSTSSEMDSDYRTNDPWGTSSTRRTSGVTAASRAPSAQSRTSRSSTASRSSFVSTPGFQQHDTVVNPIPWWLLRRKLPLWKREHLRRAARWPLLHYQRG